MFFLSISVIHHKLDDTSILCTLVYKRTQKNWIVGSNSNSVNLVLYSLEEQHIPENCTIQIYKIYS
jgi:hypothetical protein